MRILKPGGRAGLVLPDGTLFGEGVKTRIKEALLPSATSTRSSACPTACSPRTPASAPTSCSSPRARRRRRSGTTSTPIRRAPRATTRASRSASRSSRPSASGGASRTDGFTARVENEQAWRVPVEQIKANGYNLDLKNPHNPDTGPGDVDHLLPEYEKLLAQIADTRAKLKAELAQRPDRHRRSRVNDGRDVLREVRVVRGCAERGGEDARADTRLAMQGRLVERSATR